MRVLCWTPEQAEQLSDLFRQCAELARGAQEPKAQETEYDKAVTALVEAAEELVDYEAATGLRCTAKQEEAVRTAIAAVKEKATGR